MTERPELLGQAKDQRFRRLWVAVGVAMIFLLLISNIIGEVANYRSQTNHHAASVKQQTQILTLEREIITAQQDHTATLIEIKSLATAVNSVIAGLPAADKYLGTLALGLEQQITALCSATHANCPSLNTASP